MEEYETRDSMEVAINNVTVMVWTAARFRTGAVAILARLLLNGLRCGLTPKLWLWK